VLEEIQQICESRDWKRLFWSAHRRLYWARGSQRLLLAAELQNEAVVKVLGPRPVPVDVLVIAALHQAVRSTARCWRDRDRRYESLETATVRTANGKRALAIDVASCRADADRDVSLSTRTRLGQPDRKTPASSSNH
jgi:hypothetical protein